MSDSNGNEIVKKPVNMRKADWERAKELAPTLDIPSTRAAAWPYFIKMGLDAAEKQRRENE